MGHFSTIISTLLVYRHTVSSVLIYLLTMGLFVFLPTDETWYRNTIYIVLATSLFLHGVVAWRLKAVFAHGADSALYVATAFLGLASFVFVSQAWVGFLITCLTIGIFVLTTVSPRVAQFSFPFVHKGWRRLYMIAWVCVSYFFLSALYGVYLFFASFPWYVLTSMGAIGLVYATYSTIRLYISDTWKQERLMYFVLLFLFAQILNLSLLLPFGLFSFGLLLTWCWYLVTLLCRFYVSERGIVWSEQRQYLLIHGLLFIGIVTWFLRWT